MFGRRYQEILQSRPRIDIPRTRWDSKVDMLTWTTIVILLLFTLYAYLSFPVQEQIKGVNAYRAGNSEVKNALLILCIVAVSVSVLMMWLRKYPHRFNYPMKITEENAPRQYQAAVRMLGLAALTTAIEFLIIAVLLYLDVKQLISSATLWIILSVILLSWVPLFYYLIVSQRK